MIRYVPNLESKSAMLKEESVFSTLDDLKAYIMEKSVRYFHYVGSDKAPQLAFSDSYGDDPLAGWKNVRAVLVSRICVGYCGE